MHKGGISPGRGGSRRGRRGGHRENRGGGHKGGADGEPSSSDRGRGKRGGGHPSGLSGKDIGLWYARRGKEKKKQRDIENRSVVTLNKQHEEHLVSLLDDPKQVGEASDSTSGNDLFFFDTGRGSGESSSTGSERKSSTTSYYDSLFKRYGSIFDNKDEAKASAEHFFNKPRIEYSGYHKCILERNNDLENLLKSELKTKKESKSYEKMLEFRKKLPSYQMRAEILNTISQNQVSVISGETGCGKTTQVAQFILDDCIDRGEGTSCHVICTQPRRISAVSVAERVADERGEVLGKSCGYQIRLECKLPRKQGSILYCTTGILLQRLINDPYLLQISHVVLDEIHERDLLSDFLLIIIKGLLPHRPDLKVILMSATLNAEMFSQYFGNCPMLHIPGFTFPVKEFFLEETLSMINYRKDPRQMRDKRQKRMYGKKWKEEREEQERFFEYLDSCHDKYPYQTLETLENMDFESTDFNLIVEIVNYICRSLEAGAVLIFLPGWAQISKLHETFMKHPVYGSNRFLIIPLHSLMPTINQKQIFDQPQDGIRKIVIATNIAETSITIPDVVFVIDGGKSKSKTYDVETDVSGLQPVWVSKASARQRKGRAGRVQEGYCFHLFTHYHWDNFEDYALPEMLRTPLESLGLQIKILRLGKMMRFLQKAMQPPSEKAIENAITTLKRMRAFDENENLTALGYHLARIPVAPKVGRMILFGAIFSCLDPVLTIAASLDFKEPFYIPINREKEADEKRMQLAAGSNSDHIMIINAFKGWEEAKQDLNARHFCWDHFLSENILKMIENMKKQFAQLLYDIGFLSSAYVKDKNANRLSNNNKLVTAVICAGLYPNVVKVLYGNNENKTPKLTTERYGNVAIHPKSVNEKVKRFQSQWLIYHQLLKTTKLFVHDCSVVTPFALLFFGGDVNVHREEGMDTISVDHFIKFHSPEKIALLVKKLRQELDILLNKKIQNPSMELVAGRMSGSREDQILAAIIDLITQEEVKTKSTTGYK